MAPKTPPIRLTENPLYSERKPIEEKPKDVDPFILKTDCNKNCDGCLGKILIYKIAKKADEIFRPTSPIDSKEAPVKQIDITTDLSTILPKEKWNRICELVVRCLNYSLGRDINNFLDKNVKIFFEIYPTYAFINVIDLKDNKPIHSDYITDITIREGIKTKDGDTHEDMKKELDELSKETGSIYVFAHLHDVKV